MNLIPRNQISDFDSIFDDFFTGFPMLVGKPDIAKSLNAMRVDIHEDESQYEIVADLPGIKKDDVNITLEDDILTISATKESETEEKKKGKVIRRERSSGSYSRSFSVNHGVSQDDIQASFKDGVLTISVPKLAPEEEASKTRRIEIGS